MTKKRSRSTSPERTRPLRKLTELEGICLGIINKQQPCTAYRVRCELKQAPSSHWRGSAGSVYPMLARLEQEGLVDSVPDDNDGRGRQLLRVTTTGRAALKKWLHAGINKESISSVTDPIRSRMFFLEVLNGSQQIAYLDELIVNVRRYLAETESHLATKSATDDIYGHLGSLGAVSITEARLEWLLMVRKQILNEER